MRQQDARFERVRLGRHALRRPKNILDLSIGEPIRVGENQNRRTEHCAPASSSPVARLGVGSVRTRPTAADQFL